VQEDDKDMVQLTVDDNNELIDSFWVEGSRIMKIENNRVWEGFTSKEVLPQDRESFFTARVLVSEFANI
jgi:hypothetical protein